MKTLLLALALAVGGCCTEDTAPVTVYYDAFYESSLALLSQYESKGYACTADRDLVVFGTPATRYICTRCQ